MQVRTAACAVAMLATSVSCGGDLLHVPPHIRIDARGIAVEGTVGAEEAKAFPAAFRAFLPAEIDVRPGDNVFFDAEFTGELHTVTFGSLVDAAVAAIETLGPRATLHEIEALPEMQRLPSIFPRSPGESPLQVNRSAAEPCYLRTGAPPNPPEGGAPPCPEGDGPEFDGTQTFHSSGWMEDGTFEITFSEDIPTGAYHFMCLVHRSTMIGTVTVVDENEPVPGKPEVTQAGESRIGGLRTALEPVADAIGAATPEAARAGAFNPTRQAMLTAFGPERMTISASDTATWQLAGLHTISLEPAERAAEILVATDDGIAFNEGSITARGGAPPVPPSVRTYPPAPDTAPVTLSASWDGAEPFSSGLIWSTPPAEVTYAVTFTEPGTYRLRCLVHPAMEATIEVE